MFETCIDLGDFLVGILLAGVILYLFYLWIKAGSEQWDKWDRMPSMSDEQKTGQARRLRFFLTPNKWLADTYLYVMFWSKYYSAYYS